MGKKNIFLFFILVASALVFSACFSPSQTVTDKLEPDPELKDNSQDLVLEKQKNNPGASTTPTNTAAINTNPTSIPTNLNQTTETKPTPMPEYKTIADFKKIDATTVTLTTTKGDIVIDLYRDKAPLTTANFLDLVDSKFYDGMVFHRVIPNFMAQVGDPLSKDPTKQALWGTGGPGYKIKDEFGEGLKHDGPGVVSMANSGPNTGGSQIFITHLATPWLDGKHAVFGKISQGLENFMKIEKGDKIISATYQ